MFDRDLPYLSLLFLMDLLFLGLDLAMIPVVEGDRFLDLDLVLVFAPVLVEYPVLIL